MKQIQIKEKLFKIAMMITMEIFLADTLNYGHLQSMCMAHA